MTKQPVVDDVFLDRVDIYRSANICRYLVRMDLTHNPKRMAFESLEAHITLFLIHLNELLQRASNRGRRVNFADDIHPADRSGDVTDLVNRVRGAACHVSSPVSAFGKANRFVFNMVYGRVLDGYEFEDGAWRGCEYDGELAIFYGPTRVLVRRHLHRAFDEVVVKFHPELQAGGLWE